MARLIGNVDATGSLSTSVSTPATNASAVSLYLPFDNNTNDNSANSHSVTANGNAAVSASQSQFGGSSLYVNAVTDFLSVESSANFKFEDKDFTIEMFIRPNTVNTSFSSGSYSAILDYDATQNNGAHFTLHQYNSALVWIKQSSIALTTSSCLSATTWHHIVVVRLSGTLTIYCDGKPVGSITDSQDYDDSNTRNLYVGKQNISNNTRFFKGYIDDLRVTKGIALYSREFVPPSQAVGASLSGANETNSGSNLTSLYLPLNSDVNDDSSNNHTITALGGAVISSAQSKFGGSSVYLDGGVNNANGSRLRVSSDVYDQFYLSDFTMEMFIYPTTLKAARLWSQWESTRPLLLQIQSDGDLQVLTNNTSRLVTSGGVTANNWFHIALVRIGETFTLYIDGVNKGRFEMTGNLNSYSNDAYIGARYSGAAGFEGYIDDFRIVRSGIYTGNFTPPTSALTASISQTRNDLAVLYLPFDNGLDDQARSRHAVTANGNAAVSSAQAKFGGYSLALDGNGDRLDVAHSGELDLGSGDYTIEGFFFFTSTSNGARLIHAREGSSSYAAYMMYLSGGTNLSFFSSSGSSWNIANGAALGTMSLNTWTHLAVSRQGNSIRCFQDGVLKSTTTSTATQRSQTLVSIGGWSQGQYMSGYIDDLMITKGHAKYTANFTPPTTASGGEVIDVATDTRTFSSVWNLNSPEVTEAFKAGTWPTTINTQYTVLSLALDTDFTDISSSNHSMTANGNTQISTAQKKFGAGSALFDGNGDYLSTPASSDFAIGSGDFTVSLFYYPISEGPTNGDPHYSRVFNFGNYWHNTDAVVLMDRPVNGNGKFVFQAYSISQTYHMYSTTSVSNGQWYHIQVCRSGSTFYLFVNGNLEDTYTSSVAITTSANVAFHLAGAPGGSGAEWSNSYIDDVLVLKGYALNTSSFTAPTAPNQGGF